MPSAVLIGFLKSSKGPTPPATSVELRELALLLGGPWAAIAPPWGSPKAPRRPRRAIQAANMAQHASKTATDGSKRAQDGPMTAQDGLKRAGKATHEVSEGSMRSFRKAPSSKKTLVFLGVFLGLWILTFLDFRQLKTA